jgi:hypothetical protein
MGSQETKYKVQSLERGLAVLRELRVADAPVRNQDLVSRTGLPKATVSRLLNTLGALGYVRRIDRGSYVLANASGRSGRAMLSALGLERCHDCLAQAPGPVYLEARVGERWVPVYRWNEGRAGAMANGVPLFAEEPRQSAEGAVWDAASAVWCVWTRLCADGVGSFALTLHTTRNDAPTAQEEQAALGQLQQAAKSLAQAGGQ